MQGMTLSGCMNFLKSNTRFSPILLQRAPHEMKSCFFHNANGLAMLIFSSFDSVEETLDALIRATWKFSVPKDEIKKTQILSVILNVIHSALSTQSLLVAPNHILRKSNFIPKDDLSTIVCDLPERDYIQNIYAFIKNELKLASFKCHFFKNFQPYHVTILLNLLLSEYCNVITDNYFDCTSGIWHLSRKDKNTIRFLNKTTPQAFSLSRSQYGEYMIVDNDIIMPLDEAFTESLKKQHFLDVIHSIFFQCFTNTSTNGEILSSMSITKHIPDFFINTISKTNVVELKRRTLYLFDVDPAPIIGDALFYEMLVINMEYLHFYLLRKSYLGYLPAPQFALYQMHFDKCFDYEINLYINIGKMIAFSLYDKHCYCPKILNEDMIKALFIFTKKDLGIADDVSYEKLQGITVCQGKPPEDQLRFHITYIACDVLDKLTEERKKKIAGILFLLFPKILYEHTFAQKVVPKKSQEINKKVITHILLHNKEILINNHEDVISVMESLIKNYDFGDPSTLISYLKKRKFKDSRLLDKMLKEAKHLIVKAIEDIYNAFVEPIFIIAWSIHIYSKMQYASLGDKKNVSSHQLHAYISMVGKYDNFFDAIDLRALPSLLKELKYEEGILDVLGDPFDSKVISKLKETIDGFHDYHTLSNDDIDKIIVASDSSSIAKQKTSWLCEFLKRASSEEREWFFRFSTSTPYVDPNELLIFVTGSLILSNSKLVYADSCFNTIHVGLSYHIESTDEEKKHYFFSTIENIKELYPDDDLIEKAKESFIRDLIESINSYRNLVGSDFADILANTSTGKFIMIKRKR